MACDKSGKDGHPRLQRSPATDPKPEPKPAPPADAKPKPETRRERRKRQFAGKKAEAAA